MADSPSEKATRHPEFYLPRGTFIIRVEDTLYKLYHDILAMESRVFADLFSLPEYGPENKEGKTDETPITLQHLTVQAFDLFVELKFACGRSSSNYSLKELENLLEFHRKYDCSLRMFNFVTSCIMEKSDSCHAAELVHLGIEYKIRTVFEKGFSRLCDIPILEFDTSHRLLVGMDVYISYIYTRVRLDYFIRSVAVRYPPVEHADSCCDHQGCAEDWAAVWWNGMGRLLLDATHPQTFAKALAFFKRMRFGRVGKDCKKHMFSKVLHINLPAIHSAQFVSSVGDRLVEKLITTP
ncbi:hypothetical protein EDC04DRAFT_1613116 [Pisolithus marmoratus]|nr:hypothetical protein EDC04DRAFT_1613116 [Pisolithus marmoratus]